MYVTQTMEKKEEEKKKEEEAGRLMRGGLWQLHQRGRVFRSVCLSLSLSVCLSVSGMVSLDCDDDNDDAICHLCYFG